MTRFVVLGAGAGPGPRPASTPFGRTPTRRIRVITERGSEGWDLTMAVEGLNWSSVNPGGDERATFRLKRKWFAGAPEVRQGNMLRIVDGIDVLWQGRIEDNDRAVSNAEEIGVTAYGLGQRLRDGRMTEIYCDGELAAFMGANSIGEQIIMQTGGQVGDWTTEVTPDENNNPAIVQRTDRIATSGAYPNAFWVSKLWYDAGGVLLGNVYYSFDSWEPQSGTGKMQASEYWNSYVTYASDDVATTTERSPSLVPSAAGYWPSVVADKKWVILEVVYAAPPPGFTGDGPRAAVWRRAVAYGRHGMLGRGADPVGYYASDIVTNVAGRVAGIVARRIDQTSYIIRQSTFKDPTAHDEAISQTSRYENIDWGTWGPDSVFDRSSDGYLDWKQRDTAVAHWYAARGECDDVSLQVELATLYNAVDVHYTDPAGKERIVRRTITVDALDEADPPIVRVGSVEGGQLAGDDDAAQLGDAFLALSGSVAPARGSISVSGSVSHHLRGHLPAYFIRADGSNFRIPDVLASKDVFELFGSPDRRTTFPIKRANHDASGPVVKTTVDVDQTSELLSSLQARIELSTKLAI